jgi:hypothetical protein
LFFITLGGDKIGQNSYQKKTDDENPTKNGRSIFEQAAPGVSPQAGFPAARHTARRS